MFYKKKRVNWYLPALLAGPNGITQLPLFCLYLVFEFGYHSKDEIGIEKCKCKPMHLVEDQEQVKDPTFMRTFYRHEWGAFYLIMPMLEIRKATYWYCTAVVLAGWKPISIHWILIDDYLSMWPYFCTWTGFSHMGSKMGTMAGFLSYRFCYRTVEIVPTQTRLMGESGAKSYTCSN